MGTHDNMNGAEPQNEFISGFKSGPMSYGKETQKSFASQSGKSNGDFAQRKPAAGLQNRMAMSSYQNGQDAGNNNFSGQAYNDPFEKNKGIGIIQKIKSRFSNSESGSSDSRQKIMVAIIPVLFIVMVLMFGRVLWKSPKNTKAATKKSSDKSVSVRSTDSEIDWKVPEPLPAKFRDPIKYGNKNSEGGDNRQSDGQNDNGIMNVKSILFSEDKSSAVIGDKLVYLNEQINGATVVEIHKDYVVFEKDGKRWQQKVAEDILRQD